MFDKILYKNEHDDQTYKNNALNEARDYTFCQNDWNRDNIRKYMKQFSRIFDKLWNNGNLAIDWTARDVFIVIMDEIKEEEENKETINILQKEGNKAFVEHCFNPTGEKQLTYSEMRAKFG